VNLPKACPISPGEIAILDIDKTLLQMQIDRWDSEKDGLLDEAALRAKLEAMGFAVSRFVYSPGTYFPLHAHEEDKIHAVAYGHLRITIGNDEDLLGAGDRVLVPRGVEHSAEVVGDEAVVSLEAAQL
jgi:quercetin dioxygenase-like cupin family protein